MVSKNSELEDEIKIQRQPEYQFLAFQVLSA